MREINSGIPSVALLHPGALPSLPQAWLLLLMSRCTSASGSIWRARMPYSRSGLLVLVVAGTLKASRPVRGLKGQDRAGLFLWAHPCRVPALTISGYPRVSIPKSFHETWRHEA